MSVDLVELRIRRRAEVVTSCDPKASINVNVPYDNETKNTYLCVVNVLAVRTISQDDIQS